MPDITKQGRSHDASVVIEKLEGKPIGEAKTELTRLETSQVKDVRNLLDELLAYDNEDDRQKYGAIKQAADTVYQEKLEGREGQLLTDEDVETALKPLELAEEDAEDKDVTVSGIQAGNLQEISADDLTEDQAEALPPFKNGPYGEAFEAAKAAPLAEEVLKLEGEHEKLSSGLVAAWLDQYGKEKVKKGLLHMFGRENQNFADEKLDRFLYALEKNPNNLPSPELDEIRLALKAEVSSEVVVDILKDRIMRGASPLPDDQDVKEAT
ncbi:hypothetical protein KKA33_01445 [Patescibacteria group bacterium]|nr:hypothetical protein [Patescibacteria group bacterium]